MKKSSDDIVSKIGREKFAKGCQNLNNKIENYFLILEEKINENSNNIFYRSSGEHSNIKNTVFVKIDSIINDLKFKIEKYTDYSLKFSDLSILLNTYVPEGKGLIYFVRIKEYLEEKEEAKNNKRCSNFIKKDTDDLRGYIMYGTIIKEYSINKSLPKEQILQDKKNNADMLANDKEIEEFRESCAKLSSEKLQEIIFNDEEYSKNEISIARFFLKKKKGIV